MALRVFILFSEAATEVDTAAFEATAEVAILDDPELVVP